MFLAGLGFDLAGAYLVSRGLLQTTPELAKSGGTVWPLERPRVTYAVEDRCRATVGLGALALGFVLQAAGYVDVLTGAKVHPGAAQALIGVSLAALVVVLTLLGERALRPRWRDRLLVKVARFDPQNGQLRDRPLARLLASYAEELGRPRNVGEDDAAYCRRLFKVETRTE
jgi:hypothetical protein